MRQERTVQGSIFDLFAEHEIGRELEAMSQWLDAHRDLLNLVTSICADRGSRGPARKVCRRRRCCAVLFSNSTASGATRSWRFIWKIPPRSGPYMRSIKRELYLGRHFSTYGDYDIHGLNPIA